MAILDLIRRPYIGVIALLLVGCGDDGDDNSGGDSAVVCNYTSGGTCISGSSLTASQCATGGGVVVDACPAGALLTCTLTTGTVHIFDQETVDALKLVNAEDPCAVYAM